MRCTMLLEQLEHMLLGTHCGGRCISASVNGVSTVEHTLDKFSFKKEVCVRVKQPPGGGTWTPKHNFYPNYILM
jgi:hypothetical protein